MGESQAFLLLYSVRIGFRVGNLFWAQCNLYHIYIYSNIFLIDYMIKLLEYIDKEKMLCKTIYNFEIRDTIIWVHLFQLIRMLDIEEQKWKSHVIFLCCALGIPLLKIKGYLQGVAFESCQVENRYKLKLVGDVSISYLINFLVQYLLMYLLNFSSTRFLHYDFFFISSSPKLFTKEKILHPLSSILFWKW